MNKASKKIFLSLTLVGLLWAVLAGCGENTSSEETLEQSALVETGTYILTVRHSGMVLDVPNANPQAGIQLQQANRNNGNAQQFRIEAIDSTHVKVTSLLNSYALTAELPVQGGKVSLQPYTGARAQQWILVPKTGGFYEVANRASRGLLDVAEAASYAGGRVHTWSRANVDNQKWTLEKVGSTPPNPTSNYQKNLELIQGASVRNRNLDGSSYRNTAMNSLPTGNSSPLLGPRTEYLGLPGGNPEVAFPVKDVGTFRTSCEFSHFAYDDPLVHPNKPGAAHLHMFWGNTDVNAYSTYNTLKDSGSGTCNGAELNRSGYWAPALFDSQGNVRIPERIIVYYKGYGPTRNTAQVYPPGAAMVIDDIVHRTSTATGGTLGIVDPNSDVVNFMCTDQYRGNKNNKSSTIPVCVGDNEPGKRKVLEMHVKFPTCLGVPAAPQDPKSWWLSKNSDWYTSNCQGNPQFPHIHYIIAYPLEAGDNTAGWYLSSDVDPTTRQRTKTGGSSIHADWWGAWNPSINKEWIDNCVRLRKDNNGDGLDDVAHSCGFGYLTDGGPDNNNPIPGRALKYRQQYTGPLKVAASTLYRELCPGGAFTTATAAAYCRPATQSNLTNDPANQTMHTHH